MSAVTYCTTTLATGAAVSFLFSPSIRVFSSPPRLFVYER